MTKRNLILLLAMVCLLGFSLILITEETPRKRHLYCSTIVGGLSHDLTPEFSFALRGDRVVITTPTGTVSLPNTNCLIEETLQ